MTNVATIPAWAEQEPPPCRPTTFSSLQLRENPYLPGGGLRPAALVGRNVELQKWSATLRRVLNGHPARSVVLHGLTGEGKSVLLGEFHRRAEDRDWLAVIIEASVGSSLRDTLARALYPVVQDLVRPKAGVKVKRALATFKAFSVKVDMAGAWSFGLDDASERGRGDSGALEADLLELIRDVAEAAQEQNRGFVILIDEAQDLTRNELKALCEICHQSRQAELPFLVALAGLPSLPMLLRKANSFTEGLFSCLEISALEREAAREALIRPASREGVSWDTDAIGYILKEAGGHLYFLQQYGQATWDAAAGATLTFADARVGVVAGHGVLDAGLYRGHWEMATQAQRAYLKAMTLDGVGPSLSADVADRLGKTLTSAAALRDSLIRKGLIYSPQRGQVAYAVLGLADFLARQSRP